MAYEPRGMVTSSLNHVVHAYFRRNGLSIQNNQISGKWTIRNDNSLWLQFGEFVIPSGESREIDWDGCSLWENMKFFKPSNHWPEGAEL